VSEEPRREETEEDEQRLLLPVLAQPDELRWWELQLGVKLPKGMEPAGLEPATSWMQARCSPN
jgi:hypothetical protein